MQNSTKKDLTKPIDSQYNIWRKLKLLAIEKGNGMLNCRIVIRDGKIVEIRHSDFEGIIK